MSKKNEEPVGQFDVDRLGGGPVVGSEGGGGWSGGGAGRAPEHDVSIVEDMPESDEPDPAERAIHEEHR